MYICCMSKNVTITLNDKVKESAKKKASESKIRGGLSGYIELLIINDLKLKL